MDFLFSFDINRRSSYIDGRSIYYVPPPLYSSALTPLPSTTRQGGTNNNATVEKKMRNSSLPPDRDIPIVWLVGPVPNRYFDLGWGFAIALGTTQINDRVVPTQGTT